MQMDMSMDTEEVQHIQSTISVVKTWEKECRDVEKMECEFKQKHSIQHNMGLDNRFKFGRKVVVYVNGKLDR